MMTLSETLRVIDKERLSEMQSVCQKLETKYESSEMAYRALTGAIVCLHRRFEEDGVDCEPLIHALNMAALIKDANTGLPVENLAKVGAAFFERKKAAQAKKGE